jgi:hypothetical protein
MFEAIRGIADRFLALPSYGIAATSLILLYVCGKVARGSVPRYFGNSSHTLLRTPLSTWRLPRAQGRLELGNPSQPESHFGGNCE